MPSGIDAVTWDNQILTLKSMYRCVSVKSYHQYDLRTSTAINRADFLFIIFLFLFVIFYFYRLEKKERRYQNSIIRDVQLIGSTYTHARAYKYVSRHYNVNLNRAVTTQLFTFITLRRRRRKNGQHPFDHFQSYSAVIESQNFFIFFSSIDSSCRRCQRTPSWERTVNN